MPPDPGTPTLDQLKVLLTVADVGSFAAAARKLNRATSVVSYTIANLEAQLGIVLFDRATTRKPQLTDAGRTVVAEARVVSHGVDELRAKVKGLLQGLEAEVHLVLDVMLPTERVAEAAWEAVHGDKVHVTVGKMAKRLSRLARFFPGLIVRQSKKIDGLGTAGH